MDVGALKSWFHTNKNKANKTEPPKTKSGDLVERFAKLKLGKTTQSQETWGLSTLQLHDEEKKQKAQIKIKTKTKTKKQTQEEKANLEEIHQQQIVLGTPDPVFHVALPGVFRLKSHQVAAVHWLVSKYSAVPLYGIRGGILWCIYLVFVFFVLCAFLLFFYVACVSLFSFLFLTFSYFFLNLIR